MRQGMYFFLGIHVTIGDLCSEYCEAHLIADAYCKFFLEACMARRTCRSHQHPSKRARTLVRVQDIDVSSGNEIVHSSALHEGQEDLDGPGYEAHHSSIYDDPTVIEGSPEDELLCLLKHEARHGWPSIDDDPTVIEGSEEDELLCLLKHEARLSKKRTQHPDRESRHQLHPPCKSARNLNGLRRCPPSLL